MLKATNSVGFKPRLNQVKPPADVTDFEGNELSYAQFKIWTQLRRGVID